MKGIGIGDPFSNANCMRSGSGESKNLNARITGSHPKTSTLKALKLAWERGLHWCELETLMGRFVQVGILVISCH